MPGVSRMGSGYSGASRTLRVQNTRILFDPDAQNDAVQGGINTLFFVFSLFILAFYLLSLNLSFSLFLGRQEHLAVFFVCPENDNHPRSSASPFRYAGPPSTMVGAFSRPETTQILQKRSFRPSNLESRVGLTKIKHPKPRSRTRARDYESEKRPSL